jgi:hypothetical protein
VCAIGRDRSAVETPLWLNSRLVSACEQGYQRSSTSVDDWECRVVVILVVADGSVVLRTEPVGGPLVVAALLAGVLEAPIVSEHRDVGAHKSHDQHPFAMVVC